MSDQSSPGAVAERIEAVIGELERWADPGSREKAQELVRLVMGLYGAGLSRILEMIDEDEMAAERLFTRFAEDSLVTGLLALHDLHPQDLETPVAQELDRVRPPTQPLVQITPATPLTAMRCEFCSEVIPEDHFHVFHTETRNVLCACRACRLLLNGKYTTVPKRYVQLPGGILTAAHWDEFQIPVAIAFFVFPSSLGRPAAFYPGPAGSTESEFSPRLWKELAEACPVLQTLAPDVEGVLAFKKGESLDCYLVPIDAYYELIGQMRTHWKGFTGGETAWRRIEAFFAGVEEKSHR